MAALRRVGSGVAARLFGATARACVRGARAARHQPCIAGSGRLSTFTRGACGDSKAGSHGSGDDATGATQPPASSPGSSPLGTAGAAGTMHVTVDELMQRAAEQQRAVLEHARAAAVEEGEAAGDVTTTDELPGAASKGVRRFYASVGVRGVDLTGNKVDPEVEAPFYEVLIDGKPMKTNGMNKLQVPSQSLAMAIAAEFAVQTDVILPASTPLYNLTSTAVDRFPEEEDALCSRVADFLETDTVCFRVEDAGDDVRDTVCLKLQNKHYAPLIAWFEERFGGPIDVVAGMAVPRHGDGVVAAVVEEVRKHDYYFMTALSSLLSTTKSTVISMALLYRHISVDQAFDACRVEEEHQIEHHGFVYDGHDTARAHARVQLNAASSLMWLLPKSQPSPLPKRYEATRRD